MKGSFIKKIEKTDKPSSRLRKRLKIKDNK